MQDVCLSVTHYELMSTAWYYARCPSVCHTLWINVYSVMLCKMSVCLSHTLNQRLQRDGMRDVRLSVTQFESTSTAWCYARCPSVCHTLWINVYSMMLCKMSVCLSVTHFESTSTARCYARCLSVCHTLWTNVYSVMLCKMSVCHTLWINVYSTMLCKMSVVNGGGDRFWKWKEFKLWRGRDLDLDLRSSHTAYRPAAVIDVYLYTIRSTFGSRPNNM